MEMLVAQSANARIIHLFLNVCFNFINSVFSLKIQRNGVHLITLTEDRKSHTQDAKSDTHSQLTPSSSTKVAHPLVMNATLTSLSNASY